MDTLKLMVTLWPSFPHFNRFLKDGRLSGIRLNSAMITNPELDQELNALQQANSGAMPLYFDVKGRQLRVTEVHLNPNYLDLNLNHPIEVETPCVILFKAGSDHALLERLEEGGRRLIFRGGPQYMVSPGESLHIRHPSLKVFGSQFTDSELEKIEKVRKAGFKHYFLSYVESQRDVDQFIELVGKDSLIQLKIENKKGLDYVARDFRKTNNLILVAARGDLYVEIDKPHEVMKALKLIIAKDPQACVGSRILLSIVQPQMTDIKRAIRYLANQPEATIEAERVISILMEPQPPSCADFCELSWLYDIGYRTMMLCDELCLKESLLTTAVNAFSAFRDEYATPTIISSTPTKISPSLWLRIKQSLAKT
jgi:pyruvate kinase